MSSTEALPRAAASAWPRWRLAGFLLSLCGLQALLILLIQFAMFGETGLRVGMLQRVSGMALLRWGLLCVLVWQARPAQPWSRRLPLLMLLACVDAACIHALSAWLNSGIALDPQALHLSPAQLRSIGLGGSWVAALAQYLLFSLAWQAHLERRQRASLEQEARAAQLQALQNQLKPHFLFNAMNTVRGLIFENPAHAAHLLTELSSLLRASLEQSGSLCTLEEEWQLCQRYLALESSRLEARLQLEIALPPALMGQRLPRFALLGLCENAIKHGIGARRDGGCLRISAQREGAPHWRLCVENPLAPSSASPGPQGLGSGLNQLRQSLRLHLGPEAQLLAGPDASGGYRAELRLPWQAGAEPQAQSGCLPC